MEAPNLDERGSAPAVRLLDSYLTRAVASGASDLHFEPCSGEERGLVIRMRVDGLLHTLEPPPAALAASLLARTRIMAQVELGQCRSPRDGRFRLKTEGYPPVDVRAAFIPVRGGERVALRLLASEDPATDLIALGMPAAEAAVFTRALARSDGLVLVVGPTGSGKTTTLYTALESMRRPDRVIVTVEDPVERELGGIAQVEVDEGAGRGYAEALRALLRHDPDVIMIGEIRDPESARMACRAALSGHLVLSTMHALDCEEALVRLHEMGLDRAFLAPLALIGSQRLLRRLCLDCRQASPPDPAALSLYQAAGLSVPERLFSARGCSLCEGLGYRGRLPVFETRKGGGPGTEQSSTLTGEALKAASAGLTSLAELTARCPTGQLAARTLRQVGQ